MADKATLSRPRRSVRAPQRFVECEPEVSTTTGTKRKRVENVPADQLNFLLKNPKSLLTEIDISELLNAGAWNMLSSESRAHLARLLPPTAFHDYQPKIEPSHPSQSRATTSPLPSKDQTPSSTFSPDILDVSVFTDSHFLAAAHTFQDHLYSDGLSDVTAELVRKFQAGIQTGSLHAPWKDEVWLRNNPPTANSDHVPMAGSESNARAGAAAELKLVDLVKNGVIKVGDVLAYQRNFPALGLQIEKDILIESVDPRTRALTVFLSPGEVKHLPDTLIIPNPTITQNARSITITSPTMLESGLLDVDGRTERGRRPNGNAWKCFVVWRWPGGGEDPTGSGERGGRESHGTLFYLRGCFYQDR